MPEGDRDFTGWSETIAAIAAAVPVPVVVEGGGGLAPRFPAGPAWPHLRCRPCPGLNICHSWITATMNPGRARTALARPISSPIVITITSSLFSC